MNPGLLRLAPASAELIYAGKRGGAHKDLEQPDINAMLIAHARKGNGSGAPQGRRPFIFGRGGEEAEALAAAGIEFEVVPGESRRRFPAPAFAGIPLTHREHGSFVAFVTGHEDEARTASVPWDDLARAAKLRGTIVILMATARLSRRPQAPRGCGPSQRNSGRRDTMGNGRESEDHASTLACSGR